MVEFSGEVATVDSVNTVAVQADTIREGGVILSSMSTQTFADKKRAFIALDSAESLRENDMVGKDFELTDYALIDAAFVDEETGEVQNTTRVVLVSHDKSFVMYSDPLARSVKTIHASFGDPRSWDEPLVVRVVAGMTAKKHTFYKLELAG